MFTSNWNFDAKKSVSLNLSRQLLKISFYNLRKSAFALNNCSLGDFKMLIEGSFYPLLALYRNIKTETWNFFPTLPACLLG